MPPATKTSSDLWGGWGGGGGHATQGDFNATSPRERGERRGKSAHVRDAKGPQALEATMACKIETGGQAPIAVVMQLMRGRELG